jgi:RNA polymerase sigma-70 factor (ECF subfamily)
LDDVASTKVSEASDLGALYRDEGPKIWRALIAFTGDRAIAEDALSEAFAQALARGNELRDPLRWIWRVAFRVAAGELKTRGRTGPLEREPGYEHPESIAHVIEALARLSPNQRLAVVLHDYADRPVEEVAATIGSSRATVHVHLSQGRKRLRSLLEDRDA